MGKGGINWMLRDIGKRKFDGKYYLPKYVATRYGKREAREYAEELRKNGYLARVVKTRHGWVVFARKR